jgi:hypothetical protein
LEALVEWLVGGWLDAFADWLGGGYLLVVGMDR